MYNKVLVSALSAVLISTADIPMNIAPLAENVILPRPAGIQMAEGEYRFSGEPSVRVGRKKGPAESYTLEISRKGIRKDPRHLVVQLRDTQSRKNIGIVGMYLPAMPIFLCLLRLAA